MFTLKEWRRAKGISVKNVAKALDVSPSTVRNWEDKGQKMPVDMALKMCQIIGIDIGEVNFFAAK